MKIKDGVVIAGLHLAMRRVLVLADDIWDEHGHELVITCGLNGVHSAGSLHYYGRALDFRTRYFSKAIQQKIAEDLQEALGDDYDVVLEATHCHCEFHPKKLRINF